MTGGDLESMTTFAWMIFGIIAKETTTHSIVKIRSLLTNIISYQTYESKLEHILKSHMIVYQFQL